MSESVRMVLFVYCSGNHYGLKILIETGVVEGCNYCVLLLLFSQFFVGASVLHSTCDTLVVWKTEEVI